MTNVMSGVRVLEVAEHTFVPAASAILADWGADVVKIEHVERGDAMRGLGQTGMVKVGTDDVHVLLEHSNRGKRSLGLDLSSADGIEILYKLAEKCDVFLTNKNPGVRNRLRIDVAHIRERSPNAIYVRGSGYGRFGPYADAGGYDSLAFWARSGAAMAVRDPEGGHIPFMPGPAYGDSIGAMTIAGGIAAALFHRARTGEAPIVDVSLLGTGMWAMGPAISLSSQLNMSWRHPPKDRAQLRNALSASYKTSDQRWIMLTCLQGFAYWPDARSAFYLDFLDGDERFATAEAFADNSPALALMLDQMVGSHPLDFWIHRLSGFRGQWSPYQDCLEVLDDPQVVANGYVQETTTEKGASFKLIATPVQFDEQPALPSRAPLFNEHGDDILQNEVGLDLDSIMDLKVRGVVA